MITKIEEQVLMSVWRFQGTGYGVNIFKYLENINDKRLTMGVIYDVLERLTKNGFLNTEMGEATKARGGMRKKYYHITEKGIQELAASRNVYNELSNGFDEFLEQYNLSRM